MNSHSKNKKQKKILIAALIIAMLLTIIESAYPAALPEGPSTLTVVNSTKRTPQTASNVSAVAGNVSQLNIIGSTITQTWQGYYGNISGTIVLTDSANYALYDWDVAFPEGEIYASDSTIDFTGSIACYNYTKAGGGYLDLATYESSLGLVSDDPDGINETFPVGSANPFYVGTNLINSTCPKTNLYNSSGVQNSAQFEEFILYDLTANKIIYTALLEETGIRGFDNRTWNFQMIVAENGRNGDNNPTTYYFYVELE